MKDKQQDLTADYRSYSTQQLDLAFAALPVNNPNRDVIAKEIERRILQKSKQR